MLVDRTLRAEPEAPAKARELIRELPVAAEVRANLELIVTELVANSVVHGPGGAGVVKVRLRTGDFGVRGEIRDGGRGFTWEPHSPDLAEPGGLGLVLVDRLTDRWGVGRDAAGCVWFECAVPVNGAARAVVTETE